MRVQFEKCIHCLEMTPWIWGNQSILEGCYLQKKRSSIDLCSRHLPYLHCTSFNQIDMYGFISSMIPITHIIIFLWTAYNHIICFFMLFLHQRVQEEVIAEQELQSRWFPRDSSGPDIRHKQLNYTNPTQIFQSTLVLFDPKKIEVFFSKKLEVFSLKK